MPGLADVQPFAGPLTATVGSFSSPVHLTCHSATLRWLYEIEFGKALTGNEFLDFFEAPQLAVGKIMALGQVLGAAQPHLVLPEACVLVFRSGGSASSLGSAGHSCVARTGTTIVGYNQTDWFRKPGQQNQFSTHQTSEIMWMGGTNVKRRGDGAPTYSLIAVPEKVARAEVRRQVVGG